MKVQFHTPNGIEERDITDEEAEKMGLLEHDWRKDYAKAKTVEEKLSVIARRLGLE